MFLEKSLPSTIYKFDGTYTRDEYMTFEKFMSENFEGVVLKMKGEGMIKIEYPPSSIVSHQEWDNILEVVLLTETATFHPRLRRKKITVRFVDKLFDPTNTKESCGTCFSMPKEEWVMIPLLNSSKCCSDTENIMFTIIHELAESDFWEKTLKYDEEAKEADLRTHDLFGNEQRYRNLLDEKIANRRAFRACQRYWPGIIWTPGKEYEEDK